MSAKIRLFFIHIDKSFVFDESFRGVKKESGQINSKSLNMNRGISMPGDPFLLDGKSICRRITVKALPLCGASQP